jgi:hypothetical protein
MIICRRALCVGREQGISADPCEQAVELRLATQDDNGSQCLYQAYIACREDGVAIALLGMQK